MAKLTDSEMQSQRNKHNKKVTNDTGLLRRKKEKTNVPNKNDNMPSTATVLQFSSPDREPVLESDVPG